MNIRHNPILNLKGVVQAKISSQEFLYIKLFNEEKHSRKFEVIFTYGLRDIHC